MCWIRTPSHSAVAGHDAVVITLGSGAALKSIVRSKGTEHIVRAMQHNQVARLVCQINTGHRRQLEQPEFFLGSASCSAYCCALFFWTTNGRSNGCAAVGLTGPSCDPAHSQINPLMAITGWTFPAGKLGLKLKISRADIANFMAGCLRDASFMHRAVAISH